MHPCLCTLQFINPDYHYCIHFHAINTKTLYHHSTSNVTHHRGNTHWSCQRDSATRRATAWNSRLCNVILWWDVCPTILYCLIISLNVLWRALIRRRKCSSRLDALSSVIRRVCLYQFSSTTVSCDCKTETSFSLNIFPSGHVSQWNDPYTQTISPHMWNIPIL